MTGLPYPSRKNKVNCLKREHEHVRVFENDEFYEKNDGPKPVFRSVFSKKNKPYKEAMDKLMTYKDALTIAAERRKTGEQGDKKKTK